MTPALLALLLACAPDPGMPVIRLEDGVVSLEGAELAGLRDRGMIRQSRHRLVVDGLKDLSRGIRPEDGVKADPKVRRAQQRASMGGEPPPDPFSSAGLPVRIVVDPDVPFADLHVLMVSSAWAGYGRVHVTLPGREAPVVGPLELDVREDPVWQGEPITGVSPTLLVEVSPRDVTVEVAFRLRVAPDGSARRHLDPVGGPTEPLADCDAIFGEDARRAAVCREARRTDGTPFAGPGEWPPAAEPDGRLALGDAGCVAAATSPPWTPPVASLLADLGIGRRDRVVLAPWGDLPASSLVDVLGAFPAAGLDPPAIRSAAPGGTSDDPRIAPPPAPPPCTPGRIDALTLGDATARWLGERRRSVAAP